MLINHWHSSIADYFMYWISFRFVWIPLYAFLLYLLIKSFGKSTWKYLLCIAASIALSDQLASSFLKPLVHRLRPCHQAEIASQIHLVFNQCGGPFGFVSSHAANSFALAFMLSIWLKPQIGKHIYWLWLWAGLISYSRIYLGVHFPGDILGGALLGIGVSGTAILLLNKITKPK